MGHGREAIWQKSKQRNQFITENEHIEHEIMHMKMGNCLFGHLFDEIDYGCDEIIWCDEVICHQTHVIVHCIRSVTVKGKCAPCVAFFSLSFESNWENAKQILNRIELWNQRCSFIHTPDNISFQFIWNVKRYSCYLLHHFDWFAWIQMNTDTYRDRVFCFDFTPTTNSITYRWIESEVVTYKRCAPPAQWDEKKKLIYTPTK